MRMPEMQLFSINSGSMTIFSMAQNLRPNNPVTYFEGGKEILSSLENTPLK